LRSSSKAQIRLAQPADLPALQTLFREYALGVAAPGYFGSFEEEVAGLPGRYSPPGGRPWLLEDAAGPLGCVACRALRPGVTELKRLYVRSRGQGQGWGRKLVEAAVIQAKRDGYREIQLDSLDTMIAAQSLYLGMGFERISPPDEADPDLRLSYFRLSIPT
jgi:GNAT superfamily N-acetyltransferase